jgi:hypothetical protein
MAELKPATIYLDTHVHRRLKVLAAEQGKTLSALVAEAVGRLLDQAGSPRQRTRKGRLELDWAGALAGLKDKTSSVELQHRGLEWRDGR